MKLTSKARYGLKICFILGSNTDKKLMSITEIAERCNYSPKYIEKIMRPLRKADIVLSEKGVSGGYMLSKNPKDISIGSILRALEDNLEIVDCVGTDCKNKNLCPTHDVWRTLYVGINNLLNNMTLADIINNYNQKSEGEDNEKINLYGPCGNNKC